MVDGDRDLSRPGQDSRSMRGRPWLTCTAQRLAGGSTSAKASPHPQLGLAGQPERGRRPGRKRAATAIGSSGRSGGGNV